MEVDQRVGGVGVPLDWHVMLGRVEERHVVNPR